MHRLAVIFVALALLAGCDIPEAHVDPLQAIHQWFGDRGPAVEAKAVRVAQCESTLVPTAANYSGKTPNLGLYQIDSIWAADWAAVTATSYWDAWSDPYWNAGFARWLYDRWGWGPWSWGGGICGSV